MEEIKRQISRAQWRLNLQQAIAWLPWTLFIAMLVGAIGIAIPKIWYVAADPQVWFYSWLAGSIVVGIAAGMLLAYMHRRGALEAAIELDRRFGLKERISSSLALTQAEAETEFGRALLSDAARRVERVEVAEQFPVQMRRPALLLLLPIATVVGLLFLPNAQTKKAEANATEESKAEVKKVIKTATEKLQARLREQEKKAAEEGLKTAEELKAWGKKMDDLMRKPPEDRKEALIKLNDLAKEMAEQRKSLPSPDDLKKQFNKMQEMNKGPADKLAESLKEGNFDQAKKELEKIKDQLAKGDMSEADKERLADQLQKMKEKIEEAKQAREQAKQDLREKIEQKKNEGNAAEAGQLQQQLDEMEAQDQHLQQKMDKMAQKFGDAAKALQDPNGDPGDAAAKMDELAEDIAAMQDELAEADQLDDLMEGLGDAKEAMKCEQCQGKGCKECQGDGDGEGEGEGQGKQKGQKPGNGMGEGQGFGDRPEEKDDGKFYNSKVEGNVQKGQSVRIGDAGGPNLPGRSREEVKAEILGSLSRDPDALEDGALSRDQKEHAKQYFQQLRDGK